MESNKYIYDKIKIDHDWSSGAIWIGKEDGYWTCSPYENYPLSETLIKRMRFWCDWHDSYQPWLIDKDMDWDMWHAYGYSLAIDTKRELGSEYQVCYNANNEINLNNLMGCNGSTSGETVKEL